jgi:virulence factor Mce-like protein
MGTRPPKPAAIAIAVGFALSCIGFTLFVWLSFGGTLPLQAKGYRFHALFPADAVNLVSGSQVRIAGVRVGKVVATKQRLGHVDATLQIDKRYAPVPSDVRAIVRQKTLLGETFIELTPGSPTARKLKDGETLPLSQIQHAQGIDQVLGAFDAKTRQNFKTMLADFAAAFDKRGEDLNATVGNAGPTLDDLNRVVTVIDQERPAFQGLIRDTGHALQSVAARASDLQSLVTAGDKVFATTAARNRQLTDTVSALPPFLRQLRGSLAALEVTAGAAAPTLRQLRPVAPLMRPALEGTNAMAPQLTRVFRGARPLVTSARRALPPRARIIRTVNPLNNVLDPAGMDIVPVLELVTAYKDEIVANFANVASANQASLPKVGGGVQHTLRALVPLSNEDLLGAPSREPTNRHNPYFAPRQLDQLSTGLPSWDCRNTSNGLNVPPLGSAPAQCKTMSPWTFRGQTRQYPHLERAK